MDLDRIGQRGHLAPSQRATLFPRASPERTLQWASLPPPAPLPLSYANRGGGSSKVISHGTACAKIPVRGFRILLPGRPIASSIGPPLHEDALRDGSLFTALGEFKF